MHSPHSLFYTPPTTHHTPHPHTEFIASPLTNACLAPLPTPTTLPTPPTLPTPTTLPSLSTLITAASKHALSAVDPTLRDVLKAQIRDPSEEYVWEAGGVVSVVGGDGELGGGARVQWPCGLHDGEEGVLDALECYIRYDDDDVMVVVVVVMVVMMM